MSQPELWIPKTRSKETACQVPESIQTHVVVRQYQKLKEIAGTPGQPRLIVIDEEAYGEWEQAQQAFSPETGALLLDFGSRPELTGDSEKLLGWVSAAGLTESRWEFLILQGLETQGLCTRRSRASAGGRKVAAKRSHLLGLARHAAGGRGRAHAAKITPCARIHVRKAYKALQVRRTRAF